MCFFSPLFWKIDKVGTDCKPWKSLELEFHNGFRTALDMSYSWGWRCRRRLLPAGQRVLITSGTAEGWILHESQAPPSPHYPLSTPLFHHHRPSNIHLFNILADSLMSHYHFKKYKHIFFDHMWIPTPFRCLAKLVFSHPLYIQLYKKRERIRVSCHP